MLTRHRAVTGVLAAAVIGVVPAAVHAADPAQCSGTGFGQVCEVVARPHQGATSAKPAGNPSKARVTCTYRGEPTDCSSEWGTWSNTEQCWVKLADPQPAREDPIWAGRDDGAVYWCQPPPMAGSIGAGHMIWVRSAPPQVNPAQLAQQAVDSMDLRAPRVGATPLPSADATSVIGLPTWLWIDRPDARSWGPITRTAASGGVTVTATARVAGVTWDMGDGHTVTCAGPGTRWAAAEGDTDSPTCGYRYAAPGRHTITATTHWQVDWTGAGQSGTITFDLAGIRQLDVVELRAVIT